MSEGKMAMIIKLLLMVIIKITTTIIKLSASYYLGITGAILVVAPIWMFIDIINRRDEDESNQGTGFGTGLPLSSLGDGGTVSQNDCGDVWSCDFPDFG